MRKKLWITWRWVLFALSFMVYGIGCCAIVSMAFGIFLACFSYYGPPTRIALINALLLGLLWLALDIVIGYLDSLGQPKTRRGHGPSRIFSDL